MDGAILAIFNENTIAFAIASFFILIGAAIKTATGFLTFHEEFSVKRYVKRLDFLSKNIDTDSTTAKYINALKTNEVFRIASGIECYPEKAKMLMEVYLLDIASRSELKRLSQYLKPENDQISITVDWFDKVEFIYSFISMLALVFCGLYIGLSILITGKSGQIVAGVVIMLISIFTGSVLGRDHKTLQILIRVRKQLIRRNMVTHPDKRIEWDITLWPRRPEVRNLQDE
ncbi:MAG: hypothetical protein D3924_02765 [Candidatus Electrothrix sp. AR4]|nr:hypothetical protein [Candidatus Electrothrix sp. AR4]